MFRALLPRAARTHPRQVLTRHRFASNGGFKPELGTEQNLSRTRARLDKWITRSPAFFKPTLRALRDAPASYVISFAVLHEITAVVPLFGFAYAFHYFQWLPSYFAEGKWVIEGGERFGRYFRRKGWIQEKERAEVEAEMKKGRAQQVERGKVSTVWYAGESAGRWLVEFATAYAVVKLMLPLRIALSAWWAPAFARYTLIPVSQALQRTWRRTGR